MKLWRVRVVTHPCDDAGFLHRSMIAVMAETGEEAVKRVRNVHPAPISFVFKTIEVDGEQVDGIVTLATGRPKLMKAYSAKFPGN